MRSAILVLPLLAIVFTSFGVQALDGSGYSLPPQSKVPPRTALNVAKGVIAAYGVSRGAGMVKSCVTHPLLCTGVAIAGLGAGGVAIHRMQRAGDEPKCPPPVRETESMPDFSRRYQAQITAMPIDTVIVLNGVKFDGCREVDGTLLEAKGRYAQFLSPDGKDLVHYLPGDPLQAQAIRQAQVARLHGRRLEWYFAEDVAAKFWKLALASDPRTSNIVVLWQPMEGAR